MTPDSPAVSPVPPTARDLISRDEALKALELLTALDDHADEVERGEVQGVLDAISLIKMLPFSAPPVAPSVGRQEIHGHVETLRTVVEENAETYTQEGMVIFLRSLLRDFEQLLSPAPSVGELEWQREPIGDHWWIYSTDMKWKIWFNKDAPGYFVYRVNAREWVAWEKTLDDAKNFANSLQRILSGAAE